MKHHRTAFLLSELEMGRLLKLLRAAHLGRVDWSPALVNVLSKAIFPHAMEFWAALAPMKRLGNGWIAIDVPVAARCWPARAEETLDTRFRAGPFDDEVRVEVLSGAWQDANAARPGFAYAAAAAGRVWRRPGDACDALEAGQRLLAQIAVAMLYERAAERGLALDVGDGEPLGEVATAQPVEPQAAGGGAPPDDAVAAALAAGVTGDDIRLIAAFAQVYGPRVVEAVAEMGETSAAVAELIIAFDRVTALLQDDRADRIAALLDHAVDRSAEVRAIAKSRRRPRRVATQH